MKKERREPVHKDPVCGMEVSPAAAAAETTYQGKRYYFCAEMCREKFEADPAKYLKPHGSA